MRARQIILLIIFGWLSFASWGQSLEQQRQLYQQAREAQLNYQWPQARKLMSRLKDYPLYPYLQFYDEVNHFSVHSYADIVRFRHDYQQLPLANQLERRYLFWLAKKRQWALFLKFYPREPSSTSLQCSYYYARYRQGRLQQAWRGAQKLWLSGRSQPDSCNPLFRVWTKAHKRTQKLIWQRLLLAYQSYQGRLQDYLEGLLNGSYLAAAKQLKRDDANPGRLLTHPVKLSSKRRESLKLVLERLTWQRPQLAIAIYRHYQKSLQKQGQDDPQLMRQLIRSAIRYPSAELLPWADKQLRQHPEQVTLERRLRLALSQQNWGDVDRFLPLLSSERAASSRWQYWQGRLAQQQGDDAKAEQIWQQLAKARNYYGFLAAQQLGSHYQFNGVPVPPPASEDYVRQRSWQQVRELMYHHDERNAYQLWQRLLQPHTTLVQLRWGSRALEHNWPALAVASTIKARAWDQLGLRFPNAYADIFEQAGQKQGVDPVLLMSVARQESGFYRFAHSHAGARGLMQLTPSTARHLLAGQRRRLKHLSQLYKPELNIELGSLYLNQLLARFDHNRAVAVAAYNAGPTRVNQWFERFGALPVDIWIESIPFDETRQYVQNILAYELIYATRKGLARELLRPEEQMVNPMLMAKD